MEIFVLTGWVDEQRNARLSHAYPDFLSDNIESITAEKGEEGVIINEDFVQRIENSQYLHCLPPGIEVSQQTAMSYTGSVVGGGFCAIHPEDS